MAFDTNCMNIYYSKVLKSTTIIHLNREINYYSDGKVITTGNFNLIYMKCALRFQYLNFQRATGEQCLLLTRERYNCVCVT